MINIVIPMAGAGSRFVNAGYKTPKPFIDIAGKPMIVRVLENLSYPNARYILIAREEHLQAKKELVENIKKKFNVLFVPIQKLTEGTACTVLYARKYLNLNDPLLIANSDQEEKLGLRREYELKELVDDMMESDLKLMTKDQYLKDGGYAILNYFE